MKDGYFCTKCWKNHNFYSKIGQEHAKYGWFVPKELQKAVGKACMKYQMPLGELVVKYVKEGLIKDGYLTR